LRAGLVLSRRFELPQNRHAELRGCNGHGRGSDKAAARMIDIFGDSGRAHR